MSIAAIDARLCKRGAGGGPNGRIHMLHYEDCEHFFPEMPPRLASEEELRSLTVCGTCAGQTHAADGGRLGDRSRFNCPECHLSKLVSLRTESGICRD